MKLRDRRQLLAMLRQIEAFRTKREDLNGLVSSLEVLQQALEDAPADWLKAVRDQWGELEEIYSLSVVREHPPTERDQSDVSRAIEQIQRLVEDYLAKNGPAPEDDDDE